MLKRSVFLNDRIWLAGWLLFFASSAVDAGQGKNIGHHSRVVSVNQCVEQMIAGFAADQLVSVTWLSHQSHAPLNEVFRAIPANHAQIEEILAIAPDIVIGGEYGAAGLQALLEKFGITWRQMPLHHDFAMFYSNWLLLGGWLHREQQAAGIANQIQRTLAALHAQLQPLNVRAVVVNPNGWVAGSGNFQHALLEAAGLHNLVAEKGIEGWSQLSLEQLIVWQPELIIINSAGYANRSMATDWQRHPVLAAYKTRFPPLVLNGDSLGCNSTAIDHYSAALGEHLLGLTGTVASIPDEAAE